MDDDNELIIWELYHQCYECGYSWPLEKEHNPWFTLECLKCMSKYTGKPREDIWVPCKCNGRTGCTYCKYRQGFVTILQKRGQI
jgi:hypothetical protein